MAVKAEIKLTQLSQSIENNYSIVNVTGYATTSGESWNGYQLTGTYYFDGVENSFTTSLPKNTRTTLFSADYQVYHDDSGVRSVAASFILNTRISAGTITASTSLPLTTINRKTICPNISGVIGTNVGVYINSANANFTHSLSYSFNGLSGTVPINSIWTIPESFYTKIPNSKFGKGTLELITYYNGNEIGRSSGELTVYCNEADCIPTGTASLVDSNTKTISLTGDKNKIIKGFSNALINYTVLAKNGASIKKISIGDNVVPIESNVVTLLKAQFASYIMTIEDSRGYINKIQIGDNNNLVNYCGLSSNATVKRLSSTSNKVSLNLSGTFFNESFGSKNNLLFIKWRVKQEDNWSDYQNLDLSNIEYSDKKFSLTATLNNPLTSDKNWDYRKRYNFEFVISDLVDSQSIVKQLKKGEPVYNWYEKNNANYFNINGSLTIKNVNISEVIYPIGIEVTFYDNDDHSNWLGLQWSLVSQGRMDIGRDPNNENFNQVGKIGGSYELQKHSHIFSGFAEGVSLTGKMGKIYSGGNSDAVVEGIVTGRHIASYRLYSQSSQATNTWVDWEFNASHSHNVTGTIGEAGAGTSGNLPPYEVKSKWRRIA